MELLDGGDRECDGVLAGEVRTRIAGKILAAADLFGNDLRLPGREIAALAGTTVETAIREAQLFEKAGWIALRRGHIRVPDPSRCVLVQHALRDARSELLWATSCYRFKSNQRG